MNNPIFLEYTNAVVPIIPELYPRQITFNKSVIESPSLFVRYFHFKKNYILEDNLLNASSHVYYIVNGSGKTEIGKKNPKTFIWKKGDVLILPFTQKQVVHTSFENRTIIFTADDSPLFKFLKASPKEKRFDPVHYKRDDIMTAVSKSNSEKGSENRNRNGVLLTNTQMVKEKMNTLTHTMWSLMNVIAAKTIQKPHRHNSIAIDLCVDVDDKAEKEESVYTLMSKEIDEEGNLVDPVKMVWKKNCTFVTPPGWWHSHYNNSDKEAWVFPIQDAGLHTYLRTLDIQFIQP